VVIFLFFSFPFSFFRFFLPGLVPVVGGMETDRPEIDGDCPRSEYVGFPESGERAFFTITAVQSQSTPPTAAVGQSGMHVDTLRTCLGT